MQNIYMEVDGVDGESESDRSTGGIELLSYSHGVSMPLTNTAGSNISRTYGRCQHQSVTVVKYLDVSTPTLNAYCCGGSNVATVKIRLFQADSNTGEPVEYMNYELGNVLITSVSVSGGSGGSPIETLALNYTTIKWTYNQQDGESPGNQEGSAATGWDLTTNGALDS